MKTNKIVILNQKGGVGKTTTCVNLGSALAREGQKVLLVDLDSQGNLSSSVSADTKLPGAYQLITGKADKSCIQQTPVVNLYCLSGGIDMAGLSVELVSEIGREFYFKQAMEQIEGDYDYVLIDCPPALDLVTINALAYGEKIIIPMQCEYFAMEGLNLLLKTINTVKKAINPKLDILGIVFTMYQKRSNLNNDVVADISQYFPDLIFETKIPRNVRLSEAPSHGLPVNAYDAGSVGSHSYYLFAQEVKHRVG